MKWLLQGSLRTVSSRWLGLAAGCLALTWVVFVWDTYGLDEWDWWEVVGVGPGSVPGSSRSSRPASAFVPYTGEDIVSLRDVCIEEHPSRQPFMLNHTVLGTVGKHTFSFTRKILVGYNQKTNSKLVVPVDHSHSFTEREWVIQLKTDPRPTGFKYITAYPAYFLMDGQLCNLWNFRKEILSPLYQNLRRTNRLRPKIRNMVYFNNPVFDITEVQQQAQVPALRNPYCFGLLMKALGVRNDYDSFHKAKRVCYKNAVFGQLWHQIKMHGYDPGPAYIKTLLGLHKKPCPPQPVVTLIARKSRRIMNIGELQKAAIKTGFSSSHIVYFEDHPIGEQVLIAHCSDVLVGVQGAALGWAPFMRPNTSLIEIAWPEKNWGFIYNARFRNYQGMQTFALKPKTVIPNFEAFEKGFLAGRKPVTEERKRELLERTNGSVHYWNIWKYADVVVDSQEFLGLLKEATKGMKVKKF